MSELFGAGAASIIKIAAYAIGGLVVVLYLLTIIWTIRDAKLRGASVVLWGIVSIIPFLGALIYSLMRPPLYESDREEMEWEEQMRARELAHAVNCPRCEYPADPDYLICPRCGTQLRNRCASCGKPLNRDWNACPYCCTPVGRASAQVRGAAAQQPARAARAAVAPGAASAQAAPAQTAAPAGAQTAAAATQMAPALTVAQAPAQTAAAATQAAPAPEAEPVASERRARTSRHGR